MPKILLEIKTKKNRGALLVKSQKRSWSNLYIISYLLLCCQNYSQVPFVAPSAEGKVHDLNGFKWGEERDQESWNKMRVARDPVGILRVQRGRIWKWLWILIIYIDTISFSYCVLTTDTVLNTFCKAHQWIFQVSKVITIAQFYRWKTDISEFDYTITNCQEENLKLGQFGFLPAAFCQAVGRQQVTLIYQNFVSCTRNGFT